MFYFPSFDGPGLYSEIRFLPSRPPQGSVRLFVDELLLGPLTDRYRMLFSQGTRVRWCIQQGRTLYLDLSAEGLFSNGDATPVLEGIAFLKKNIKTNFPSINRVEIFIDGQKVEENPR